MRPIRFSTRRRIGASVTLFAVALFAGLAWLINTRLGHASVFTGATLLACLLGLILLGLRRRLPFLRMGNVSTWTQVHLYTGFFTTAIYVLHAPAIIGDGILECSLSIVFLTVTVSGFYGIYISRTIPRRLTQIGGQHRFDRVQWHRNQIAMAADKLMSELQDSSAIRVLGGFSQRYLQPFFDSRPSLAYVLAPNGVRRRRLLSGLGQLNRYLETEGRGTAGQLSALVRRRDDLDYQFALQLRLRLWLVLHGFLSIALVVGGFVHAFVAWQYIG